ncbi:MAG TPA: gamma-glutamylcyclotransferase [Thermomicrobiales bacterium]|nr:gamma-glutamylcyclotransferase [Thermomicrobiales bacterium]
MPYFAYCTLLDKGEMQRFVPAASRGATGQISGWRVVFERHAPGVETGGCNLSPADDAPVYGVLYDLSEDGFAQLDAISGVDRGLYQRFAVRVMTDAGEVTAETYVIPNPGGPFQPTAAYVRPILAGARELGLPNDYVATLDALVRESLA